MCIVVHNVVRWRADWRHTTAQFFFHFWSAWQDDVAKTYIIKIGVKVSWNTAKFDSQQPCAGCNSRLLMPYATQIYIITFSLLYHDAIMLYFLISAICKKQIAKFFKKFSDFLLKLIEVTQCVVLWTPLMRKIKIYKYLFKIITFQNIGKLS